MGDYSLYTFPSHLGLRSALGRPRGQAVHRIYTILTVSFPTADPLLESPALTIELQARLPKNSQTLQTVLPELNSKSTLNSRSLRSGDDARKVRLFSDLRNPAGTPENRHRER